MAINFKFIRSNNTSWQDSLAKERTRQINRASEWASKTAKTHLRKVRKFIIRERLAGHTVAATFGYKSLRVYSGYDMQTLSDGTEKPKLELRYPTKITQNSKHFCPEAHKAFENTYREAITNGLGVKIDDMLLTEINEDPNKDYHVW